MSNYLTEIESEYSRIRGRWSMLSPMDWQLAQNWENQGCPLHIILNAMSEVSRQFESSRKGGKINSLSYFKQEVEKQFANWKSTQVGKADDSENYSVSEDCHVFLDDETTEISADFICIQCKFYSNTSDNFYEGFCKNTEIQRKEDGENYTSIYSARERCNPECLEETKVSYDFFEEK